MMVQVIGIMATRVLKGLCICKAQVVRPSRSQFTMINNLYKNYSRVHGLPLNKEIETSRRLKQICLPPTRASNSLNIANTRDHPFTFIDGRWQWELFRSAIVAFAAIAGCVSICSEGTVAEAEQATPPAPFVESSSGEQRGRHGLGNISGGSGKYLSRNFIADAVEIASPALVNITIKTPHRFGLGAVGISSGSGFIISAEEGLILTNAHVVHGNETRTIQVTLNDGRTYIGRVHSLDVLSDLALVQINVPKGESLPVMKIGTSSQIRAGEWVVALGSPLTLQNSVSAGIVSAVARHSSEIGLTRLSTEYIQTDAAINVGNSGGPLINLDGEVIGINSMKAAGGDGISFAIPIDAAWPVVDQLRKNKRVVRPYIGMKMITFNPATRPLREISRQYPQLKEGVIVLSVTSGSPAEQAGLKPLDIIVGVDGGPVTCTKDILGRVGLDVGKDMRFDVLRDGSTRPLKINITTRPMSGR